MHAIVRTKGFSCRQNFGQAVTFNFDVLGKFPNAIVSETGEALSVTIYQDGPYTVSLWCLCLSIHCLIGQY